MVVDDDDDDDDGGGGDDDDDGDAAAAAAVVWLLFAPISVLPLLQFSLTILSEASETMGTNMYECCSPCTKCLRQNTPGSISCLSK